jgi:hypothetical protein
MYNNPNTYQSFYPQPPKTPMPSMAFTGLKGRPVSSLEEVRATSIDFDGSVFFFPDLANRRIYTKQISGDGTAILNMYELKEIPMSPPNMPAGDFITRQEFEEALNSLKNSLMPQQQITPQQEIMNF